VPQVLSLAGRVDAQHHFEDAVVGSDGERAPDQLAGQSAGKALQVDRLAACEPERLRILAGEELQGSTPMPTRFDLWIRSKLSARTARTPSSAGPLPPSHATSRSRTPCRL